MKKLLKLGLICGLLGLSNLSAQDYVFPGDLSDSAPAVRAVSNELSISGIFGKAKMKQGTCKKDGWLYGVRGNYDLYFNNLFYVGAESGYKWGDLSGKACPENPELEGKVKSQYSDFWVEGRIGGKLSGPVAYLTPYFVVGYEKEHDDYIAPSPIELDYKLNYGYLGCGALSAYYLNPCMTLGLNFKMKWMFNAKHKVGGSPYIEDKGISCAGCYSYNIELPFTYFLTPCMKFAVIPFYEFKNYDKHKFELEGKEKNSLRMYGALIQLGYNF